MKKLLITGGKGDIAVDIANNLRTKYEIFAPGSKELDVTKLLNVQEYINANGPFDVIINNAGSIHPKRILESDEQKWLHDILVNLVGPYYVTKNCLAQNIDLTIINIASTAAYAAYNDWGSYCSSKSGLITFTKSLASDNYKAYAIAPGAVLTKFRNNFDLPNDNALEVDEVSKIVVEILAGNYLPGNVIFIRKNEKKIL